MSIPDDALRDTMAALETPAYYDGAFKGMEEEVSELRTVLASCGDFRLEQWRKLVRDYDCAWKALKAQAQEIARLRDLLHRAGHSFQDHWAIDWQPICKVMEEEDAKNALGGGK